jgi:hypothetical protein
MKPLLEPMPELQRPFAIKDTVRRACESIIDSTVNQSEKDGFYEKELAKISSDIINKDVEWSSLRLEPNQIVSAQRYNLLTGQVSSFQLAPAKSVML